MALGTSADRVGVDERKGMKEKAETDVWALDGSETNERNNEAGALPNVLLKSSSVVELLCGGAAALKLVWQRWSSTKQTLNTPCMRLKIQCDRKS
jgi:hypothetical protein